MKVLLARKLKKESLLKLSKDKVFIDKITRQAINVEYFKEGSMATRKWCWKAMFLLIYEYIKTYLFQLLKVDAAIAPFTIESCEEDYFGEISFESNGKTNAIKIGGKIDRLDRVNGRTRVIDYKTGNVKALNFQELPAIFDTAQKEPKKEVFQALFYSYIVSKFYLKNSEITAGVYDLKKLFANKFEPLIKHARKPLVINDLMGEYEVLLQNLLSEMFFQ